MRLEAIRVRQFGGGEGSDFELYMSGAKFGGINERLEIDRWSRANRAGYQRVTLIEKRVYAGGKASLFNYLNGQLGLFPTSILLAIREEINFSPLNEGNLGVLEIPEVAKLYVIDGMHRVEALRAAIREDKKFTDYWLNLAIFPLQGRSRIWELLLFHIVNSRTRKLETDLAYRQMQTLLTAPGVPKWVKTDMMTGGELRGGRAAQVVDLLADESDSPFSGKVQYYGEQKQPFHLVEDSMLIRYISSLFKESIFKGLDEIMLGDLLETYWTAIAELYEEAFKDPRNYNLLGSHFGVAVMTYLFPTIWSYCVSEREGINKENIKKYLSPLKADLREEEVELDPDFKRAIDNNWWSRAYGAGIIHATGEKMFRYTKEQMEKKIAIVRKRSSGK